jgi:hypothetical protein
MQILKVTGIAAAVMFTSSCMVPADYARQEEPYWSRADATSEQFMLERKNCVDEVEIGLFEESYVDPLFRMSMASRRLAAMDWARDAYIECMHESGWHLARGARISAPGELYYP